MSHDIPDISEHLAELYSACHEEFRRLMTEARDMTTDEEQFVSDCETLCNQMVELQRTWNEVHRSRLNPQAG